MSSDKSPNSNGASDLPAPLPGRAPQSPERVSPGKALMASFSPASLGSSSCQTSSGGATHGTLCQPGFKFYSGHTETLFTRPPKSPRPQLGSKICLFILAPWKGTCCVWFWGHCCLTRSCNILKHKNHSFLQHTPGQTLEMILETGAGIPPCTAREGAKVRPG